MCSPDCKNQNTTGRRDLFTGSSLKGGAIIDHEAPRERRFVAVET